VITSNSGSGSGEGSEPPPFKRKKSSSDEESSSSSSDGGGGGGVKVKKEGVPFGAADIGDEVVEVRGISGGNGVFSSQATTSATQSSSFASSLHPTASIGGGGGGGGKMEVQNDDDEDIAFVGCSGGTITFSDMPHPRDSCFAFPFSMQGSPSSNEKFCHNCYCYVCDTKASECIEWVCLYIHTYRHTDTHTSNANISTHARNIIRIPSHKKLQSR